MQMADDDRTKNDDRTKKDETAQKQEYTEKKGRGDTHNGPTFPEK
jgi:hypothetical protein